MGKIKWVLMPNDWHLVLRPGQDGESSIPGEQSPSNLRAISVGKNVRFILISQSTRVVVQQRDRYVRHFGKIKLSEQLYYSTQILKRSYY